ncbi:methyltransferase domain-containing protein [Kitasatospora sp. MAP5-34]|uniref:class I SAM-dependent methyltransferase n=1 Tax=Kitasatospora sp. MAP5-34 TaxID=3035102 RepID=UPI0024767B4C|nr:methyltransferase domain-containing protein [Kitasatospora sp. MAP5-34]MDH6578900.1 SAM-dependent methyltransferase [Kitasatospora sp. MAP5-34]
MASTQVSGTTAQRPRTHGGDDAQRRARDWAEIQERMLVPLYQAVYDRLEVGPATSLLGLGCRSGLALLLAAERGAQVSGVEPGTELRELAQGRGLSVSTDGYEAYGVRPATALPRSAHSLVTVFDQLPGLDDPAPVIAEAARRTLRGGQVVLAGWGPPERCESASVLDVAHRRVHRTAGRAPSAPFALSGPGALETLLADAGLRPAGSGLVSCPFAYADLESAVRGLLATGLYRVAVEDSGPAVVAKELAEALQPYVRPDASVRMANVFRYVVGDRTH